MNREQAIQRASELAYEEDADQVVGRIGDEWVIAHIDDEGRQHQMKEAVIVSADGEVSE